MLNIAAEINVGIARQRKAFNSIGSAVKFCLHDKFCDNTFTVHSKRL